MDDYGFYIWSAYGAAGIAVAALTVACLLDYRSQLRALARLEQRDGAAHD